MKLIFNLTSRLLALLLIFFGRSKDKKCSSTSTVWKRILSGIVLAPSITLLVFLSPISCIALICIATVLLSFEYYQLAEKIGTSAELKFIGSGLNLLLCLSAWIDKINFVLNDIEGIDLIIFLAILLAIVIQIIRQDSTTAFLSIATIIFGTIYIGWAFGVHMVFLRLTMDKVNGQVGIYLIFFLLAVVWLGDTGAYAFGKVFGKHKLIPSISPGKTVEGSIGGLLSGMLSGIVVKLLWLDGVLGWMHFIILAIVLGVVGQIGDLGESLLKRNAGVKDSGSLIPGHGGLFDRCDSLILAAPVLYYYVYLIA